MPNLGDYIGHLVSEITIARMQADLEAIRIAELYVNHPLLRSMPVPRFRIPKVELDIPIVIKHMEEEPSEGLPKGAPTLVEMRRAFDNVLTKVLDEDKIRVTPEIKDRHKIELDRRVVALYQPREVAIDTNRVADELSKTASKTLAESGGPVAPSRQPELEKKLKEMARREFHKLRKAPPRLQVLVTSSEIREAGPSEFLTNLHMSITEEAFEWTIIESEGVKRERLVIE